MTVWYATTAVVTKLLTQAPVGQHKLAARVPAAPAHTALVERIVAQRKDCGRTAHENTISNVAVCGSRVVRDDDGRHYKDVDP